MIIVLHGPDDYRREQKKSEITGEFIKKYSAIGAASFDMEMKDSFDDLSSFLRNQSMFEPKKLAVVENLIPSRAASSVDDADDDISSSPKSDDIKKLTALLKFCLSVPNLTILICLKKKPTKTFTFLLKDPVIVQEFEALAGPAFLSFAKAEAKRNNVVISPSALSFLAKVYDGNTWALATEIQKIGSFKSTITDDDLKEFDLEAAPNYWGLVNAAKGYDLRIRFEALERLFAMNDPAPKIFNILSASWREKTAQMAAYDRAIKSGKMDYEEALVDLVIG
jgi:DNA polymerase III delta subunit